MRTMLKGFLAGAALLATATTAHAQVVELTVEQYDALKAEGSLPAEYHVAYSTLPVAPVTPDRRKKPRTDGQPKGGGGNGFCDCWIEPDNDYNLAMTANDDGSSALITLPFDFNLYGELYNTCYINNNGNVSFLQSFGTYTASGFPSAQYKMVAPFWADVDTRGTDCNGGDGGEVLYRVTPTAMYVNWVDVGYYGCNVDKRNSFQVIITDGTDPVIGVGNNVAFCYKDMQWTTGEASCLTPTSCTYGGQEYSCNNSNNAGYGFCGGPSTTGANRGNGIDFIQFTRNDHPGTDYDGPFDNPDGVDWLDFKSFRYTTAVSTQNIPPIVNSNFLCDTVEVCMGELVDFNVTFLTPEGDQTIINTTATAPTIGNFASTVTNNGTNATINVQFIPNLADTGYHEVTFTAQDDGADSLISTATIILAIYYTPDTAPTIYGSAIACEGIGSVLTASPGYSNYYWSNGYNGQSVLVGPGTYYVLATAGNCRLASAEFTVTESPNPTPTITGQLFSCGGLPATLGTTPTYDGYQWSNGSTDPTITVGTGSYAVTVTDANGCIGTAPTVNVVSANDPVASFISDSPIGVFPGTTVTYTNTSTIDGSTITGISWYIDSVYVGNGSSMSNLFDTPGVYIIMLTVTTADGCTSTYSYQQIVVPTEIEIPNVFSPNGDGANDALTFEGVQWFQNSRLKVFNRWGQVVFESSNYKNTWRPSKDIPEGTYYFELRMAAGEVYTGHVTLLR